MAIAYNALVFKCLLLDSKRTPVKNFNFGIQVFNNQLNSWENIDTAVASENGTLNHTYKIPSRISLSDIQRRAIREVVQASCTPQFRLVKWDSEQIFIVANTAIIKADTKTLALTLDFKTRYLLNEADYYETSDRLTIAESERTWKLQEQLKNKTEELNEAEQTFKTEKSLTQEALTALEQSLNFITEEKSELETQLNILKETLDSSENTEEDLALLNKKIEELTDKIEALKKEYNKLKDTLTNEQGKTKALERTITNLNTALKQSNTEVAEKQKSINELAQFLNVKNNEIKILNGKIEELNIFSTADNPNKLEAQKVYTSIVNDIVMADTEMDTSRFKLANISMNLKATIEKGPIGTMLGLIDFESAQQINGAAISEINIDIVPNTSSIISKDVVPNILGLTESAVRNILVSYGLKLDVVYQPTDNPKLIEGQSFKQFPEAGSELTNAQEVIVIFSKPL